MSMAYLKLYPKTIGYHYNTPLYTTYIGLVQLVTAQIWKTNINMVMFFLQLPSLKLT